MRALEAELWRTFPAIKKQIDALYDAGVIEIIKDQVKWSITIHADVHSVLKNIFLFALKKELANLLIEHEFVIKDHYLGRVFGFDIETDLVIVYQNCEKPLLGVLKDQISDLFRKYGIEIVYVTFLSTGDWQKRYQLADRFVLSVMRVHSM